MSNAELYAEAYPPQPPPPAAMGSYGELPRRHYTNNKVWPADDGASRMTTTTTISTIATTTTTSHGGEQLDWAVEGSGVGDESSAFFENVERKFYYNNNNIYKIFLFF